jgi:hypothetical protein
VRERKASLRTRSWATSKSSALGERLRTAQSMAYVKEQKACSLRHRPCRLSQAEHERSFPVVKAHAASVPCARP